MAVQPRQRTILEIFDDIRENPNPNFDPTSVLNPWRDDYINIVDEVVQEVQRIPELNNDISMRGILFNMITTRLPQLSARDALALSTYTAGAVGRTLARIAGEQAGLTEAQQAVLQAGGAEVARRVANRVFDGLARNLADFMANLRATNARPVIERIPLYSLITSLFGGSAYLLGSLIYSPFENLPSEKIQEYTNYALNWYAKIGEISANQINTDGGAIKIEFLNEEIGQFNRVHQKPREIKSKSKERATRPIETGVEEPDLEEAVRRIKDIKKSRGLSRGAKLKMEAVEIVGGLTFENLGSLTSTELVRAVRASGLEIKKLENLLYLYNKLPTGAKGRGNEGVIKESIRVGKEVLRVLKETADEVVGQEFKQQITTIGEAIGLLEKQGKLDELKKEAEKLKIEEEEEEEEKPKAKPKAEPIKEPTTQEKVKSAYEFMQLGILNQEMSDSSMDTFVQSIESSIIDKLAITQININKFKYQKQRATRPHIRNEVIVFNNLSNFV